jgi:hypothetical protein
MQTKLESFVESSLNVASGFFIALVVWKFVIVPLWGFDVSTTDNLAITGVFTVVSVARGYVWRRIFNGKLR